MSCLLPRVGPGWDVNHSSPPRTGVHPSGHRSKSRPSPIRGFVQEATLGPRPCSPPTWTLHQAPRVCPSRPQPEPSAHPPGRAPEHDSGLLGGGQHTALHWWHTTMGTRRRLQGQPTTQMLTHQAGQPGKVCPLTPGNCRPVQPGLTHRAARLNYGAGCIRRDKERPAHHQLTPLNTKKHLPKG